MIMILVLFKKIRNDNWESINFEKQIIIQPFSTNMINNLITV